MNTPVLPQKTETLAIVSLVTGIAGIFLGPFGFVPAIVCGHMARARIRRDPSLGGDGMAVAGLVVGYIAVAFFLVSLVLFLLFIRSTAGGVSIPE